MASFNTARDQVRPIPVPPPIDVPPPDFTVAKSITAVSGFGKLMAAELEDSKKQGVMTDLEAQLNQVAADVGNVNAINPDSYDISQVESTTGDIITRVTGIDPSGEMGPLSERMNRLLLARKQSKIKWATADLEAEVVLREAISKSPLYADDFRKVARDTLGLNISGKTAERLLHSGEDPKAKVEKSVEQKAYEAVQQNALEWGVSFPQAQKIMYATGSTAYNSAIAATEAKTLFSAGQTLGTLAEEQFVGSAQTALFGIGKDFNNTGVFMAPDMVEAKVQNIYQTSLKDYNAKVSSAGITDLALINQGRTNLASQRDSLLAMVKNKSMLSLLTNENAITGQAFTKEARLLFPDLALLAAISPNSVDMLSKFLSASRGTEQGALFNKKLDPGGYRLWEQLHNLTPESIQKIILDIQRGTVPTDISVTDPDAAHDTQAINDASIEHAVKTGDSGILDASVKTGINNLNTPHHTLSQLLQLGAPAYNNASPETKALVKRTYVGDVKIVTDSIAGDLQRTPGATVRWNAPAKKLEIVLGADAVPVATSFGVSGRMGVGDSDRMRRASAEQTAEAQFEYFNTTLAGYASSPLWGPDLVDTDIGVWGSGIANYINAQLMDESAPIVNKGMAPTAQDLVDSNKVYLDAATGEVFQYNALGKKVSLQGQDLTNNAPASEDAPWATLQGIPNSAAIIVPDYADPQVQSVVKKANELGLDSRLAVAIPDQETNGQWNQAISSAGAQGLFQLTDIAVEELSMNGIIVDPTTREGNITGGIEYMKMMLDEFDGDLTLALAAYNAGPSAVRKAGSLVPNFPETMSYVKQVLARLGIQADPSKFKGEV